jgi:hypothetical protein
MRFFARLTILALALGVAALLPSAALADLDHPAPSTESDPAPLNREFTAGGPGAKWEFIRTLPTGNPQTDLDFFTRGGETFASVGTLAAGLNGGGQTIVQLTDNGEVKDPRVIGSAPTASCVSNPRAALGLQHDVEATPKGDAILNTFNPFAVRRDAQLLVDATDNEGRCHDQGVLGLENAPQGGLELLDLTSEATRPPTIGLTSHVGEAHTVNIDPKRPHIAYAITSDAVGVSREGQRQNEDATSDDRLDLDGFEVVDLSSCMNFPADTSLAEKRAQCAPEVYRYRYPRLDMGLGHTVRSGGQALFGCHELELYPNDRLSCGGGNAAILLDMAGAFDGRGTPDDFTDDKPRGTPLPCRRRDSSSLAAFQTQAKVVDCVNGGTNGDVDLGVANWQKIGAPSLEGVKHLGSAFHQGRGGPFNALEDVDFNHETELTSSGRFLIATDERGGGVVPPGASCVQGADNKSGNGGLHAYAVDRLLPSTPTTAAEAWQSYARTSKGEKAIYRAPVRTGAEPTVCTAHVFQQIPGQNRIFMGWYSQGTQVVDFTENPDGTLDFKEAGFFIPANANEWVSHVFKAQENPNGSFTYWGVAGDFNLGARGRNAIEIYKVTLPAPPRPANGPGVVARDGSKTVTVPDSRAPGGQRTVEVTTASGAPECTPDAAFRSTTVKQRGRRLGFGFRATAPATIDVFRQSRGRTVVGERLVKRFRNVEGGVRWDGRDRKGRRLGDGYYVVRFSAPTASGSIDRRRVALLRRNGRFRTLPRYSRQDSCGLVRTFKIERPVFGGRTNRALNVAFRFGEEVRGTVTIARANGKVVKTYPERSYRGGQVHRLRMTAKPKRFPRGRYVVTLTTRGPDGQARTERLTTFRI